MNGIGPQWGITHSSPPPPFNMGVNVDLDPIFCDDYFMNVLRGWEWEWDWAPVVDYTFIPPSSLLNLFVGVAVYFEPKILFKFKYISYSLFTL